MQTQPKQFDKWNKSAALNERVINHAFNKNWESITYKRLDRWKKIVESDEGISLNEVLATYQIDEDGLKDILSTKNVQLLNYSNHQEWIEIIEAVSEQSFQDVKINPRQNIIFFNFVKPFLQTAKGMLEEKLIDDKQMSFYNMEQNYFNSSVIEELLDDLAKSLASISSRTLILELNVARVSNQLKGKTSEERATYYNEVMLNDEEYLQSIREEYLVLSRLLAIKTKYWIQNTYDILCRFYKDKPLLETNFNEGKPLGTVVSIDTGSDVSDSHNEGKTVAIFTFKENTKIVYKPRSLEVDEKFNDFINYLNSIGLKYKLKTVRTINKGSYGWSEFIQHKECQETKELNGFYRRIGSYLAILYALNAVDFHHQNLIAQGEYPVLIDLESLFHNNSRYSDSSAFSKAQDKIEQSVLRIGLLPRKIGSKDGIEGIDLSGLGAQEGQVSPHKTTVIVDRDKDTIRIEERNYPIPVSHHRPMMRGKPINAADYEEDIIVGFKETYSYFMNHKEDLLESIDRFKDVTVRQILRGTSRYANLLRISLHPDFMRDGLDREMILGKLWLDTKLNPYLKHVVHSEKNDLFSGDIPYFYSKPKSTHLWNSKDNIINHYFKTCALKEIQTKINNLNKIDCDEQISFIRTAILVIKDDNHKQKYLNKNIKKSFQPNDFLQEAIKIGEYLAKRAVEGEQDGKKDLSWIGSFVDNKREDQFKISPTNSTLYEGVSGISLFFAYLGYHTNSEYFTEISKQSLVPVLKNIPSSIDIGAFGGIASYLYLLDHLSLLWNDEQLILDALHPSLDKLENLIEKDNNNDILTGAAGTAIVLCNLYKRYKNKRIYSLIKKCGDQLIDNLHVMEVGVGWKVEANPQPASGFAHGASGIIWALYEIYRLTNDPVYKKVADKGLEFEKTLFVSERNNWADIKLNDGSFRHENFVAWCNGAAGIGLSRLLLLPYNQQEHIRNDAKIAMEKTLESGFEHDHSLCHGDLGNLDILTYGAKELKDRDLEIKASQLSHQILWDIKKRGWLTGFEKNNESPSLMMGYAGIGLGLLKIFSPTQVPSVLMLQSPLDLNI
ncbi:type 2 lanthipeptide synthetase LanM family protein [Oceanobacillus sp. J11TS1]|uniref:type 2 lanthipeptide synthetase LanM family protein n=1 Tax=Oceanobacillus sp. J11TS1 TaxID=2807191 RepID=UPI001B1EF964|nr:type 2 lanthipeptide synthetase LanM family protein [Oceanobacillus sp. J11TS1]GIO22993.1 type 2 lantibiotic biosynthesis protein [Oceanobacillus sp. J11TS1]